MAASPIVDQYGRPYRSSETSRVDARDLRRQIVRIKAAYDAASNGGRNEEHWKMADGLSSAAANSMTVRKTCREKARYEYCNNGYAKGLAWTLATDLVGRRIRTQWNTGDKQLDTLIQQRLGRWMKAVKLAKKIRIGRVARGVDGEAFLMRQHSPRIKNKVKVGIRVIECDHFDDPTGMETENYVSGVSIDPRDGEADSYTMMLTHPGDLFAGWNLKTTTISERDVFHWFKAERGGQIRGVSEMCQSLSLYAQVRRYTLATLDAAETAAAIAAFFETQGMPQTEDGVPDYDRDVEAFDDMPIEHGTIITAPRGYKASQIKAEHPTTTYKEFRDSVIDEAGVGQHAPSYKARGNSASYNYSSVQMDGGGYWDFQGCEREELADDGLDKFVSWYFEAASLIYPEFRDIDPDDLPDHQYYFDGKPHADEVKHAKKTTMMVDAELMAEDDFLISEGIDPDEHWPKIEEQRKRRAALDAIAPGPKAKPASDPQPQEDEEGDEKDEEPDDSEDVEET